jgi:hypothetical protein
MTYRTSNPPLSLIENGQTLIGSAACQPVPQTIEFFFRHDWHSKLRHGILYGRQQALINSEQDGVRHFNPIQTMKSDMHL